MKHRKFLRAIRFIVLPLVWVIFSAGAATAQDFIKDLRIFPGRELRDHLMSLREGGVNTRIGFLDAEKRSFLFVRRKLEEQGFELESDSVHTAGCDFMTYKYGSNSSNLQNNYRRVQLLAFDFHSTSKNYKGWASIVIERHIHPYAPGEDQFLGSRIYYIIFPQTVTDLKQAFATMQVRGIIFNASDVVPPESGKKADILPESELAYRFGPRTSFLSLVPRAIEQTCTIHCPSDLATPACSPKCLPAIGERYAAIDKQYREGNATAVSVALLYNLFTEKTCLFLKTALALYYPGAIQ